MGKVEFNLDGHVYDPESAVPSVGINGSGNPLDPVDVRTDKALGRFGAIPPFFIPDEKEIIRRVADPEALKEMADASYVVSRMPFRIKRASDKEWFTLPLEPLVSVAGKNIIVRRNVAKAKNPGSVKERWGADDYVVTIKGVISNQEEDSYPENLVKRLLSYFSERRSVEVEQDVLLALGIKHLALEAVSFPHTKGINNQNYEIKAYSDSLAELLIEI